MNIKTGIANLFKGLALALSLTILLPPVVKLTHVFTHTNHEVCDEAVTHTTHFHKSDFDCDFYKFKLTHIQYFKAYDYVETPELMSHNVTTTYYISYPKNQQLTRFLRGPPRLV